MPPKSKTSTWDTLTGHLDIESRWTRSTPALKTSIIEAEKTLDHPFPDELKALLLETNGVVDANDGTCIIWDVKRIKEDNAFRRTDPNFQELYMPFDSLLFFGDNGASGQFAIARTGMGTQVYVWEDENDSRRWVAGGIGQYLQRVAEAENPDWFRDI